MKAEALCSVMTAISASAIFLNSQMNHNSPDKRLRFDALKSFNFPPPPMLLSVCYVSLVLRVVNDPLDFYSEESEQEGDDGSR